MLNNRYIVIDSQKNIINPEKREMLLLHGAVCAYGKCAFCDYYLDNMHRSEQENIEFNRILLANVAGISGVLEIINSGSVFELPEATIIDILDVCQKKGITKLYFESFVIYASKMEDLRKRFAAINVAVKYRLGVESFESAYRTGFLRKALTDSRITRWAPQYESACLLAGVEGQTMEMVQKDIATGLKLFNRLTVNVFVENTTAVKADPVLKRWFYSYAETLRGNSRVEIFLDNEIFI